MSCGAPAQRPAGPCAGKTDCVQNLKGYISMSKAECLNSDTETTVESVLNGNGSLKSDADVDEQLLLQIPFSEKVKIKSVSFSSSPKNDDESPPALVKLYVNQPHMDFNDADSIKPTEVLELTQEQMGGEPITVKFTKFQSVDCLCIFIESNMGDSDVTTISNITINGSPISGTDMSQLKKSG